MYTMTKSQCFDTRSSPDKCDGEERRGGGSFKRPRKKLEKKKRKNQMMQRRVEKLEGGDVDGIWSLENASSCQSQYEGSVQLPQIERRHAQPVAVSRIFVSKNFEQSSNRAKGDSTSNGRTGIHLMFAVRCRRLIMSESAL